MVVAWQTARLGRVKEFPKLETVLARKSQRQHTVGQHKAALQMLSMQYKIPLRLVKVPRRAQ